MRKGRFFKLAGWLSILAIVGSSALIWVGSEKFIVPRRRILEERHVKALQNPREYGFELEAFEAPADDGIKLKAFLISPAAQPGVAVKTRRMRGRLGMTTGDGPRSSPGTIVMLHGRSGLKEDMFPIAERFVAAGFRCIAYDARAHGRSEGVFTTYGFREKGDLSAVLDTATARFGARLQPFLAFGNSQGAAVVIQALPDEKRIKAAVAVSPFAALNTQAHLAVQIVVNRWSPPLLTRVVTRVGGWRAGFDPGLIRPVDEAPRIQVPVMIVHGGRDRVIPPAQGLFVFEAMCHPSKVWREVPEGYHFNVLATGHDDLYQEMIEFWLGALKADRGPGPGRESVSFLSEKHPARGNYQKTAIKN